MCKVPVILGLILCLQIEFFVEHLSHSVVNDQIFPNISSGFMDTNPVVRESTVKVIRWELLFTWSMSVFSFSGGGWVGLDLVFWGWVGRVHVLSVVF